MITQTYSNRFIVGGGQCGYVDSNLINPADLAVLRTIDSYTSSIAETQRPNISSIQPVTFPFTALNDQYGSLTWDSFAQLGTGLWFLVTTTTPHGFSSGNWVGWKTQWPTSGVVPTPTIAAASLPAWTLASDITSTGQTSISITPTTGLANFGGEVQLTIGSEQMSCTGGSTSGTGTVVRGINGTTAATYTAGTPVYAAISPAAAGGFAIVIDNNNPMPSTQFLFNMYVGSLVTTSGANVAGTTNYTSPNQPAMNSPFPLSAGAAYEMCSSVCGQLAAQNGEHVMFVPLSIAVTDACITALFNEQIIPYINSKTKILCVLNNELWNTQEHGLIWLSYLYQVVPNPYAGGTGYNNYEEYGAGGRPR